MARSTSRCREFAIDGEGVGVDHIRRSGCRGHLRGGASRLGMPRPSSRRASRVEWDGRSSRGGRAPTLKAPVGWFLTLALDD